MRAQFQDRQAGTILGARVALRIFDPTSLRYTYIYIYIQTYLYMFLYIYIYSPCASIRAIQRITKHALLSIRRDAHTCNSVIRPFIVKRALPQLHVMSITVLQGLTESASRSLHMNHGASPTPPPCRNNLQSNAHMRAAEYDRMASS